MFLRCTYHYANLLIPTTVSWQGYTTNLIQIQGYSPPLSSFNCAPNLALTVLNDVYIRFSSVNNKLELIREACYGKLKVVSDTSYTPTMNVTTAAAAWIMKTDDRNFSLEGSSLFFSPKIIFIQRRNIWYLLDFTIPRYNMASGNQLVGINKDKIRQLNRNKRLLVLGT